MNESLGPPRSRTRARSPPALDTSPLRMVPAPVARNDRRPEPPPFFKESGACRFLEESSEYANDRFQYQEISQ